MSTHNIPKQKQTRNAMLLLSLFLIELSLSVFGECVPDALRQIKFKGCPSAMYPDGSRELVQEEIVVVSLDEYNSKVFYFKNQDQCTNLGIDVHIKNMDEEIPPIENKISLLPNESFELSMGLDPGLWVVDIAMFTNISSEAIHCEYLVSDQIPKGGRYLYEAYFRIFDKKYKPLPTFEEQMRYLDQSVTTDDSSTSDSLYSVDMFRMRVEQNLHLMVTKPTDKASASNQFVKFGGGWAPRAIKEQLKYLENIQNLLYSLENYDEQLGFVYDLPEDLSSFVWD